jgi:hypothetical protein
LLQEIDSVLRQNLCDITNVNISDDQWKQASLPVNSGGLGVRSISAIAPSAFLASESSTLQLQNQLLDRCSYDIHDHHLVRQRTNWQSSHPTSSPPSVLLCNKQRCWDKPSIDSTYTELLTSQPDDYHKARLIAAAAAHSGDWLNALPISSCGLRLDDEAIRVAVGLRLGANLCEPHICPCGALVDCRGSHGLSCKMNSGRMSRHNNMNDLIFRALIKAGIPATKEPAGLSRTDGKRPDGVTQIPWMSGKCAVWDVTVINTLADSYLSSTSVSACSAAELAAARKEEKYAALSAEHLFVPLAFESLGPIGAKATSFLRELGRRLTSVTDDTRETAFLFQRLSVCLQRFNAVCFRGCFGCPAADTD